MHFGGLLCFLSGIVSVSRTDSRTIDEVMSDAFKEDFITSTDASRIAKFSADEVVAYFAAHPQEHLTAKLRDLMRANEQPVRNLAREVVTKIAAMSALDHLRMEGMGLLSKPTEPPANGPDGPPEEGHLP